MLADQNEMNNFNKKKKEERLGNFFRLVLYNFNVESPLL